MDRILSSYILKDLPSKIVLVMGPRQCGKTTLAKQLYPSYDYFNYDSAKDRLALKELSWDRAKPLIIFDELHKKKDWKRWLKGIYDTEGIPPEYLVTGSAKLNIHRKAGDSLAGRHFTYRLHPFDLKEIVAVSKKPDQNALFEQLWNVSGFPEPFLKGDLTYYKRWRRTHLDIILRQDLIDITSVKDIKAIETLVELLKQRIGSTVSYASLARDLEYDQTTIKRWLNLLEDLYIIFRVTPFSKKITRSLLKEPKFYFYDHTYAEENEGARLENIVACALLKEIHFLEDTKGIKGSLHYLRTKDGKEIDFLVNLEKMPPILIEVKQSDTTPSKAFDHFSKYLSGQMIQLVKVCDREKTYPNNLAIRSLIPWLAKLDLLNNN
ncbi:MAG: ATP-binding protein [Proteobacteria bacterium]|nr:ATP-binding protein [Pseudomonadota bacterium]